MLAPWKKSDDKLDSLLKRRGITSSTKVCRVKAMLFPVVIFGCESWTIKKAESQRINALELWCWWRLLRFPWTARRSNQTILKEINSKQSLEEVLLKLKLQYSWPPDGKSQLTRKDTNAGKDWGQEEKGVMEDEMVGWHHWLIVHESKHSLGDSESQGMPACYKSMGCKELGMKEQLNWKTTTRKQNWNIFTFSLYLIPPEIANSVSSSFFR